MHRVATRHEYLLGQAIPAPQMASTRRSCYSAPPVPLSDAEPPLLAVVLAQSLTPSPSKSGKAPSARIVCRFGPGLLDGSDLELEELESVVDANGFAGKGQPVWD